VYRGGVYWHIGAVSSAGVGRNDSGFNTPSAIWRNRVKILVHTNDLLRSRSVPTVVTHCKLADDNPTARWWSRDASALASGGGSRRGAVEGMLSWN